MSASGPIEGGTLIDGRYELSSRLGEGAFGEVWRAHDRRLTGRFVALKFLRIEHMERPDLVARFEAEAGALSLMQHPNVVAVLDRGEWQGQRFLVTEFVEGQTLSSWLQRHRDAGRLPDLDTVRQLFDQVCAGVESAHAVRSPGAIVHRDIKPDNVIIREMPGGDLAAKVLDFGIAQLGGRSATRTGMLLGTPAYMAPEQAMGQTAGIQPFTDVFALGVLLTEMLTLNPHPRGEETWWAVTLREGHALHAIVARLRADLPPAVVAVVVTALSADGGARHPHAGALRAAMRGAWPSATSLPPTSLPPPAREVARTVAMHTPIGAGFPGAPPSQPPSQPPTQLMTQYAPMPYGQAGWTPTAAPPLPQRPRPSSSPLVPALLVGAVALLGAGVFAVTRSNSSTSSATGADAAVVAPVEAEPAAVARLAMVDAERIPVGASPTLGPANALITVVEFSDFQCPFCSRVEDTLRQIRQRYGDDVRIVWKNAPLPFHNNATPAAEAAMEAFAQGGNVKFWQMHDLLYMNQQNLDSLTLDRLASQTGLNMVRFREAMADHRHQASIERDKALAQAVGAQGTPNFFINGTQVTGAQPFARFSTVIDTVLARARTIQPRSRVYAQMVSDPVPGSEPAPTAPAAPAEPEPDPAQVLRVPVGSAPVRGSAGALVTMVIFSDFQCPFCARVEGTIASLRARYGDDLRVVWKNEPLPFHTLARPAAAAAMEAWTQRGEEGFWQMHDLLFEDQQHLTRRDLDRRARRMGLDLRGFRDALDAQVHEPRIAADHALAQQLEANGTPHFFINGRRLVGAQPEDAFARLIDETRASARAFMASHPGTTRENLYERMMAEADTTIRRLPARAAAPAPAPAAAPADDENHVYAIRDNPNAPSFGPADARVVIQHFSDYQCPFCSRVAPQIAQIRERYGDRVRFVWRDYPLPFHNNAMLAGEAAQEAFAQRGNGGFWRFHDHLFENQQHLERADLERYAVEQGLDLYRFRAALDRHTHQARIRADMAAADATGAQIGTPAFFINGKFFAGALPFADFQRRIDAALAAAR